MTLVIATSLFIIGITLAFSLITLSKTRVVEELIDIIFVLDG